MSLHSSCNAWRTGHFLTLRDVYCEVPWISLCHSIGHVCLIVRKFFLFLFIKKSIMYHVFFFHIAFVDFILFLKVFLLSEVLNFSKFPWLKKNMWVIGVLRKTVVCDWRFDNLCGSNLHSQVIVLVSWKFKNPGERFDWSIHTVAVGKCMMWLAVKTRAKIGYTNRWVVKWIMNNVLLYPVE